jgi:5-methylcytosine-specific restriction endonuclease McrA
MGEPDKREDGPMSSREPGKEGGGVDDLIAEARRNQERREKTYRERALKLFPWVCARCGREFSGKKLRELTVHHKDHDHDNNPPDGSNWELLCLYCHDNEHSRYTDARWYDGPTAEGGQKPSTTYKAFAGLDELLKDKK